MSSKQKHQPLSEFFATSIAGNDILSSALYVSGIAALFAGVYAPIVLLAVAAVLFFYRAVYKEVVGALPVNGGACNALLNFYRRHPLDAHRRQMGNISIDPRNSGFFLTYFIRAIFIAMTVISKKTILRINDENHGLAETALQLFQTTIRENNKRSTVRIRS